MLIERLGHMYTLWGPPGKAPERRPRIDQTIQSVRRFIAAIQETSEDRKALFTQSQQMRRKAMKLAYLLLASESDAAAVRDAFSRSGLLSGGQRASKLDALVWMTGTEAASRGIHPYTIFLIMTAFFGPGAAEAELRWLQEKAKTAIPTLEEFIVPGDLTDTIEEALKEPARLQRTIRIAGMPLSASAFAGCSLYYIEKILALLGPVGAAILAEMIRSARQRLMSDEIGTAQQAFLDLFGQEEGRMEAPEQKKMQELGAFEEEEALADPDLIRTTTNIVMLAEAKILKATLASMSDNEIASILRCMEAIAHERLLSLISPGRQKHVLAVIQKTGTTTNSRMLRDAQLFAQKLLAAYAPKNLKPGESLSIPEKVRALISSLLSRE
jgi:hypothetical protein